MRRIRSISTIAALALVAIAGIAAATPNPTSVVVTTRVFNDCPGSTVTVNNSYPALLSIDDVNAGCVGFANLHIWRFSEDGATAAEFQNNDSFRYCATLVIDGTGHAEAGLQIRPWWSESDGRLQVRTTDGEIAAFGGRLPSYNFTTSQGLNYVKGTAIFMEIIYRPNGLSAVSPATIEYNLTYNSINYTSGVLSFDEGNPTEDPPHGLWGILNPAYVGGNIQFFPGFSPPTGNATATWRDICYDLIKVGVEEETWSTVKGLYR